MNTHNCRTCQFFKTKEVYGDGGLCTWANRVGLPYWIAPVDVGVYSTVIDEDNFECFAWQKRGE